MATQDGNKPAKSLLAFPLKVIESGLSRGVSRRQRWVDRVKWLRGEIAPGSVLPEADERHEADEALRREEELGEQLRSERAVNKELQRLVASLEEKAE